MPDGAPSPPEASVYVHVPFCRAKCRYCAFFSLPADAAALARGLPAYLDTLEAELEHFARSLGRLRVPTVFLGGGTPGLLGPAGLERVLSALRERLDIAPDAEITLEANPESTTPELLRAARALGVSRLSLGAQSLDDQLLRALGRAHDARQVRLAVDSARAAGFENLGLDLIWGLPGQDPAHWLGTLAQAVALEPEHLSCYGLSVEPGTALAADEHTLGLLPDEEAQERMYLDGAALLQHHGFEHYEVSNFARPGRRCRHNQATWQARDCLGLGPAAASTLNRARWANPASLPAWTSLVRLGLAGTHQREALTPAIRAAERLMLALRTTDGLDLSEHHAQGGPELLHSRAQLLDALQAQGLAALAGTRLRLTTRGLLLSTSIIRALGFE